MPIFREPGVAAAYDPHALFVNPSATDPTEDNWGNPLVEGAWYYNTVSNQLKVWNGTAWIYFTSTGGTITGDLAVTGTAIIGDPGTEDGGIDVNGITYQSTLKVSDIDGTNYAQTILHRHSTTLEPLILGARSNSNTDAHTNVTAGQGLFTTYGAGYAGTSYKLFGSITLAADSGTISNTSAPGKIVFSVTPDGSVTPATALTISNDKKAAFVGPISTNSLYLTPYSRKNAIINGGFDIPQRGAGPFTTNQVTVDMWPVSGTGSTKSVTLETHTLGQTDVPQNPQFYLKYVSTSVAGASNYNALTHKVEGVRTMAGETITLSFYAKADAAKNIAVEFTQVFGTGGSPSATVESIGAQLVALTTSWARYSVTVAIPSISGKTLGSGDNDLLGLNFWLDAGSSFNSRATSLGQQSGTFYFSNVQLERGSVATPFEVLPRAELFALCHRYYQAYSQGNMGMTQYATNIGVTWTPFLCRMRAIPSTIGITGSSFTGVNTGAFSSNQIAINGFTSLWSNVDAVNDNGAVTFNWTASAEL